MKHVNFKLAAGVFCLLLSAQLLAQDKKIALVTFYSDKKIGGTGLGTASESLINDPSFNLKPLVDKSYERFVNEFAKDFPFKLIDNAEIVGNAEYKSYRSKFLADTTKGINKLSGLQYVTAKDLIFAYGDIPGLIKEENRDQCNLIKIFPAADGTMFVVMDYEFESRIMGLGAGIRAYLSIFLYDKKCEKVFRIRESAASKGKVPAVAGIPVMDPKKIQPLCQDATDELFEDLKGRLGKIVKKSAAKL
jgi:hypothetical protein